MNKIGINNDNRFAFKNYPSGQVPFPMTIETPVQPQIPIDNIQIPYHYQKAVEDGSKKSFKEKVKTVDMMGIVYPWLAHPLLTLGTAAGIAVGVDKFAEACGGEYDKSLLAKAAKLGDKFENSSFVKSEPVQGVISGGKNLSKKIMSLFKSSDVIDAIRKTPSQAEWRMVKDETLSMRQRMVQEFSHLANTLKLAEQGYVPLKNLGLDKSDKTFLEKLFKGVSYTEEQASNAIQLKRLGKTESEISNIVNGVGATQRVKDETLKILGKDITPEYLKRIENATITAKDTEIVEKACKNAKDIRIGAGNIQLLGKVQPFERKITCKELYNRLYSMGNGAKTKTGRFFSKFLQMCHRGFTFGGGKMNALFFVAPFLVESIVATMKADKNEKLGTGVHGLIESVSWVFTFPIALQIMHHLAGAQYAGMGETKVQAYRNKIESFNEKVKGNKYKSYKDYRDAKKLLKKELKELEKVKGQNLLTKTCRKLGKFVTLDLETIKSYRGGNALETTLRKTPNFFKNVLGVPMRFGIWIAISTGVLDGAINKTIKLLFGNYHDRFKAEEQETAKKEQKAFLKEDLKRRLYETQAKKLMPEVTETVDENQDLQVKNIENEVIAEKIAQLKKESNQENKPSQENKPIPKEEVINQFENLQVKNAVQEKPTYTYIPNQNPNPELFNEKNNKIDNYDYIPSSENTLPKKVEENSRKYIPAQTAANISKSYDNSGLEPALRRADRAEQRAIQTLAGNFQ